MNVEDRKMLVGRVRTSAEQVNSGMEDRNTYQRFFLCADCKYRWQPHADRYLRMIVFHRPRNEKIVDLSIRFAQAGQTCFVFAERIEHVELLGLMVKDGMSRVGIDPARCAVVHGEMETNEAVKKGFNDRAILAVVGNKVWGEGTDIPTLRWVINASAGLPGIALEQLIGRALRKATGKKRAGFVDFLDGHDKTFSGRSNRRLDFLRSKGFSPSVLSPSPSHTGRLKYRK